MVDFTVQPKAVNGLFAVDKGDGTQRLILDARPAISVRTACKGQVADARIDRALASDVRPAFIRCEGRPGTSYFHRFVMPSSYRAGDVGLGDLFGQGTMIFPCMTRLPMGWSHSVLASPVC